MHEEYLKNMIFCDAYNMSTYGGANYHDMHLPSYYYDIYEEDIIRQDFSVFFQDKAEESQSIKDNDRPIYRLLDGFAENKAKEYLTAKAIVATRESFVKWVDNIGRHLLIQGEDIRINSVFIADCRHCLWCMPEKNSYHCTKTDKKGSLISLVMLINRKPV